MTQTITPTGRARGEGREAAGRAPARHNIAESPLALLYRTRSKCGTAYLTQAEFEAGERLRADFTRAMLSPRLGIDWDATGGSRGSAGRSGGESLSDSALSARLRVGKALTAVGPELSGVLVDICCFLKGLKTVETERQWPARSAKLILKTALAALARHYNPAPRRHSCRTQHRWGASDYKPRCD